MNREQKLKILEKLEQMYPEAKAELVFSNPYEMLVATILSAQCTDRQVNKVTPAVFSRYPDPVSMASADVSDLYPMVKSCGFSTKASNIISACRIGGRPKNRKCRFEQCIRNSCICRGYACFPGLQPSGALQSRQCVRNRKTDDPDHPERKMGTSPSLADLAWPPPV